jgi:sirohydrochlorin cobaltochelatase
MTQGTILFAHGSRDPLWRKPAEAIAERVRTLDPARHVACAYLEMTEPDIQTSAADMARLGVDRINVVPLFLGVGKHAREDLPLLMAQLQAQHSHIAFTLQGAVGEDDRLVDLIAHIALSSSPIVVTGA